MANVDTTPDDPHDMATWVEKGEFIAALRAAAADESLFGGSWWPRVDGREAVQMVVEFLKAYEGTDTATLGDRYEGG